MSQYINVADLEELSSINPNENLLYKVSSTEDLVFYNPETGWISALDGKVVLREFTIELE